MYNNYYNSNGNMLGNNTYMQQSYPSAATTDFGPNPFVVDINKATLHNNTFRTALWTGNHLQLTLMSIPVGEDIGLEVHPNVDQFLRIEDGQGLVQMGDSKDNLYLRQPVFDDFAIFIPAGTWHNVTKVRFIKSLIMQLNFYLTCIVYYDSSFCNNYFMLIAPDILPMSGA